MCCTSKAQEKLGQADQNKCFGEFLKYQNNNLFPRCLVIISIIWSLSVGAILVNLSIIYRTPFLRLWVDTLIFLIYFLVAYITIKKKSGQFGYYY